MGLYKQLTILSAVVALLVSACVPITPPASQAPAEEAVTPEFVEWGYEGAIGPEEWGSLTPDFVLCDTGESQSPIDLTNVVEQDLENIAFSYLPTKLNILNDGHTIQVNYDPGSYIEVDGKRYDLVQFHFHIPGEHPVNGQPYDGELHLVHLSSDGSRVEIGLHLVNGTVANAFLAPVIDNLPSEVGSVVTLDTEVNANLFLPMGKGTFRYGGSLTTPPCTEGVDWFIFTLQLELSAEQFDALTAIIGGNNRPIQPINGRTVTKDITH